MNKLIRILREELAGLHPRLLLARMLLAPLPIHVGGRVRVMVLRLIGFSIGPRTLVCSTPIITGGQRLYGQLRIGCDCWLNVGVFFDLGAPVLIGDRVAIGHEAMLLTSSHAIGSAERRAAALQAGPITIGDGVWLGARCIILPGVSVGAGAMVAAGAVVNRDVPPNAMVAGVPARVVKTLPEEGLTGSGTGRSRPGKT